MSSPIEYKIPEIFKAGEIKAVFTLLSPDYRTNGAKIPGFNLGLSSEESPEKVQQNIERLATEFGINLDHFAYAKQVHGNRIQQVKRGGCYDETDALITDIPGITLAIQVADCAAVLICDPVRQVSAAVHAGWRGVVQNIVPLTVKEMSKISSEVSDMRAYISPCLSEKAFEVGEEVAEHFPEEFVNRKDYRKPHVNLKAFIFHQLRNAGLEEEQIETDEGCTLSGNQYYSYRRQKKDSGRMMAVIQNPETSL